MPSAPSFTVGPNGTAALRVLRTKLPPADPLLTRFVTRLSASNVMVARSAPSTHTSTCEGSRPSFSARPPASTSRIAPPVTAPP